MGEFDIKDLKALSLAADDSGLARRLGLELVEVAEGYAKARLRIGEEHLNLFGLTHGGALYALADHVCSVAGNSLGRRAVIVQSTAYFFANPDKGQEVFAEGSVVKSGRTLGHLEIGVRDGSGRLCLSFTASICFLDKEEE